MADENQTATDEAEGEMARENRDVAGDSERAGVEPDLTEADESVAWLPSSFTPGQPASTSSKIAVVLFAVVLIIGGIYVASPDDVNDMLVQEREGFDEEANRKMLLGYRSPFLTPGISQPEIWSAADIRFAQGSPVVGVSVGDSHRAYPVITLMSSFNTDGEYGAIVNDTLGGKLITVTNDSDTGLVRVFRLAEGSRRKTIGLWLMGRDDKGGMVLTFDKEIYYRQDLKEITDLADHAFTRGTFAEWHAEHPETDVYVGDFLTTEMQMQATLGFMTTDERIEADRVIEERNRKLKILSPNRKNRPGTKAKTEQSSGSADAGLKARSSKGQQTSGAGAGAGAGARGKKSSAQSRVNR